MKNHIITIKNPACYDLDPYIGKYCEYTSIDEPDKPLAYAGHIERDSRGEAMVHDSGEDWVYAYTGVSKGISPEKSGAFIFARILNIKYIEKDTRRGLSGLLGRSPDPSESPRTFAGSAANW